MTMLVVTHEIQFAREVASNVFFLDNGLIAEQGTAEEVLTRPQNARTKDFVRRVTDGQKVLLSIRNMGGESTAAWSSFLGDLNARGLGRPEFVIVDGAPGLEAALAQLWGEDLPIQRCTVHKHRNLLAHAPKHLHEEIGADYRDMIYAETAREVMKRRQGPTVHLQRGAGGIQFRASRQVILLVQCSCRVISGAPPSRMRALCRSRQKWAAPAT